MVWPLHLMELKVGMRVCVPNLAGRQIVLTIFNPTQWVALVPVVVSPIQAARHLFDGKVKKDSDGIYLSAGGKDPLVVSKLASLNAYRNFTGVNLNRYAKHLGLRFEANTRPKTVEGWVRVLAKFEYPDMPEEELTEIVALRKTTKNQHVYESVLAQGNNDEFVDDMMDERETKDAKG